MLINELSNVIEHEYSEKKIKKDLKCFLFQKL
jgi:hypothetical protein